MPENLNYPDRPLKIVTVTLNPALDLTATLGKLNLGGVNLITDSNLHAAGKGINVAKVLSDLGANVCVTGFLGENDPQLFKAFFKEHKLEDQFIAVAGYNRTNIKIVDNNKQVTDINFPSIRIDPDKISAFEERLFKLAQEYDAFIFSGSLPKGISPKQYAKWLQNLHDLDKKVWFDSSRDAFAEGIKSKPWLIKPNKDELQMWLDQTNCNMSLKNMDDYKCIAKKLCDLGIANVVISLGEDGVIWQNATHCLSAKPPKMEVISTVGAGDTLVAGLCFGYLQNKTMPDTLRFATALSALAVTQIGVGADFKPQELENLMSLVIIEEHNN